MTINPTKPMLYEEVSGSPFPFAFNKLLDRSSAFLMKNNLIIKANISS